MIFFNKTYLLRMNIKEAVKMNPDVGIILLIIYPIVLVGAIIWFGKHSVKPD